MGVILAPNDVFRLVAPPAILFGDVQRGISGIEPGTISSLTQAGAGSGSVRVSGVSRDAFSVVLRCRIGGEINVSQVANPGALPEFDISTDGGVSFGPLRRVTDTLDVAYIDDGKTGLRFTFENGTAPSFVASTTYAFSVGASPDVLNFIEVVEAQIFESAAGRYDPPITAVPAHWKMHAAQLVMWSLLKKIGVSEERDVRVYYPKDTYDWLEQIADGRKAVKGASQGVVEKAPGTSFATLVPYAADPLIPPI